MVRLILRSVVINRNNIREVSLCKWLIYLPEIYPAVICTFAVAEIPFLLLNYEGPFHWYTMAFKITMRKTTYALHCS